MRARALFSALCLIVAAGLPMASAEVDSGDTATEEETTTTSTTVAEVETTTTTVEEGGETASSDEAADEETTEETAPPAEEALETSGAEAAPNQAPVAVDDALTILLDQTLTIDVVANDSDPDSDPLALIAVSAAAHGTASLTEGGILYAPNPGYKGYETLTYTISDGELEASASLVIQVDPPPVAVADTASTPQGQAVVINVLANDTDADGDPISVANVTDPPNGTAVVNPDDTVTYTPDAGFKGFDTFTYTANDGTFDSTPGTVAVLVHAQTRLPADIPFMIDESGSMGGDIEAMKDNVDFIARQLEVDLDPRYALVGFGSSSTHSSAHGGTNAAGSPHTHTDFTDKEGLRTALDQLVIDGGTEPGVEATTHAMTALTGYRVGAGVCALLITDEDSDYLTEEAAALAAARTALDARGAIWFGVVDPQESGTSGDYGPDAGSLSQHTGGQVFDIEDFRDDPQPVLDAILRSCVTALVQGINLTPAEATNDVGDPHTVLAIVRDNSGAAVVGVEVTFRVTAGPNTGKVGVATTNASGEASFTYTSTVAGTDTIEASFLDQEQQLVRTDTATKTWLPRPVAVDDSATTDQDQAVTINVLANDSDPEGDELSVTDLTQPSNGVAVLNSDGSVTYTPNSGFSGSDTFTYRATDGSDTSNVATVNITVRVLEVGGVVIVARPTTEVEAETLPVTGLDSEALSWLALALMVLGTGTLAFDKRLANAGANSRPRGRHRK